MSPSVVHPFKQLSHVYFFCSQIECPGASRHMHVSLLCFVVAEGGMDPNPFNKILSGMNMHQLVGCSPRCHSLTHTQIKMWVCLKMEYPQNLTLYSLLCPYQSQCCDIVIYSSSIQTHISYHFTSSWLVIPLRFR